MRNSVSAIAAMVAAAAFGGSAFAEGDYYEGASKTEVSSQESSRGGDQVDTVQTGSLTKLLEGYQDANPAGSYRNRISR